METESSLKWLFAVYSVFIIAMIVVKIRKEYPSTDSVLELANTDFTQSEQHEDLTPGAIRKYVEADMRVAYPGKPTSRKRVFKDILNDGTSVQEGVTRSTLKNKAKPFTSDSEADSADETVLSGEESGGGALAEGEVESLQQFEDELEDSTEKTDSEEEGISDFDGSILGEDNQPESPGSEVEDEQEEEAEADDRIQLLSSRARDIDADIAKGKSIQNQLTVWEKLIESRIKLQPGLLSINKIYQKEAFNCFKSSLNSDEEEMLLQAYSSLSNLMKGLLDLQENLFKAVPSFEELKSQKRKKDESDREPGLEKKKKTGGMDLMKEIDEDFKPTRNATIQKWNEKTRISSGRINKNDFSAFDLPTLKQIEEILLNQERLLRRTRTKRSDYTVLGKIKETEDVIEDNHNENSRKKNQGEYDAEIFDDDDFYHKLLRDFIEKKTSDVSDVSKRGRQWVELQKLRSRMKAKVDMRASKGRKLRFTVHNKMVNFMAPVPSNTWTDEAKNELFKSLFC